MNAPLLEVEGLNIHLTTAHGMVPVVRNLSLNLRRGETLCLVGESGSGKSLTALALMDLLPRTATRQVRRMVFDGEDLSNVSEARMRELRGSRVAMVFQEPATALNPTYTIGEQLIEVHRRHIGSTRRTARECALALMEKMGIGGASRRLAQFPHEFSGGLRQRIMIAMALMCKPLLLIADEPTTALDVTTQAQILRLLVELQHDLGIAILLITHDLGIVARVANNVAVMYLGEIVESAPTVALFAAAHHPYTRGLMASVLMPQRRRSRARLATIPGTVPSLFGRPKGCAFRDRCSFAMPACAEVVALRAEDTHQWRCVLATLPSISG